MKENGMSKGNSPAFPCQDKDKQIWTGMNLRDYFALEAMNSLIKTNPDSSITDPHLISKYSYRLADSMLEERVKYP